MKYLRRATYCNLLGNDYSIGTLIHSNNVANIALKIASEIGLCYEEKQQLYEAGLYHDIGKSKVPESILYKIGKLSADEWEIMKKHAIYSYELYLSVGSLEKETIKIAKTIRHHHENWDGTGYPDKLAREDIPLHSRILKIADIFEAMTQPRAYRSFKIQNTLELMEQMQGKEIHKEIFQKSYDVLNELLENSQEMSKMDWKLESLPQSG